MIDETKIESVLHGFNIEIKETERRMGQGVFYILTHPEVTNAEVCTLFLDHVSSKECLEVIERIITAFINIMIDRMTEEMVRVDVR